MPTAETFVSFGFLPQLSVSGRTCHTIILIQLVTISPGAAGASYGCKKLICVQNQPIINTNQRVETPPLPATSMPNRRMATLPSLQKNPVTGLTRTESALLSPSEQLIASRT